MREIADRMRQKHGSAVVGSAPTSATEGRAVVAVTPDLTAKIKAGDIIKQIAPISAAPAADVLTLRRRAARILEARRGAG